MKRETLPRILALSPTYTGGSWVCVEELIKPIVNEFDIHTLGLGEGRPIDGARVIKIPYPLFEKFNPKYGSNIYLNAIYQIPLQLTAAVHILTFKPRVIISNGFTPVLFTLLLCKLLKIKIVVYYGSYLAGVIEKNKAVLHILRILDHFVDHIFVNSVGSQEDVSQFISINKVTIIEHWTDIQPVLPKERDEIRRRWNVKDSDFILLYVGRLVPEKGVRALVDLINMRACVSNLKFWIVGNGMMEKEVASLANQRSDVEYKGFLTNRTSLRELYAVGDLLWTFADETYIAKPGIESLAVGTPLMIPNTAAIIEKYDERVKVKRDLIPSTVGWVVDDDHLDAVSVLLDKIIVDRAILSQLRGNCIVYAKNKHSRRNIESGVNILKNLIQ